MKYRIEDNFLHFWFRFIYKYRSAIELSNFEYVRSIVQRDYETYSGMMLEKYFRQTLMESKQFSDISTYWDKKGMHEIDIVAINERDQQLYFYEVKRNKKRISLPLLENKAAHIIKDYTEYTHHFRGISLDDLMK